MTRRFETPFARLVCGVLEDYLAANSSRKPSHAQGVPMPGRFGKGSPLPAVPVNRD
jgi:hypothetical protein